MMGVLKECGLVDVGTSIWIRLKNISSITILVQTVLTAWEVIDMAYCMIITAASIWSHMDTDEVRCVAFSL